METSANEVLVAYEVAGLIPTNAQVQTADTARSWSDWNAWKGQLPTKTSMNPKHERGGGKKGKEEGRHRSARGCVRVGWCLMLTPLQKACVRTGLAQKKSHDAPQHLHLKFGPAARWTKQVGKRTRVRPTRHDMSGIEWWVCPTRSELSATSSHTCGSGS
jgi:hypothetical protein